MDLLAATRAGPATMAIAAMVLNAKRRNAQLERSLIRLPSEGSRAETKYECSLSSVRNGSERIREKERKSGGVRKANNYYTDGGRDGRTDADERRRMKERFGRKYSEQQAREGGPEEAGRE